MSAHNFNDTQVTKVVGKHLKNKRYIFQWTFALWWLWENGPQVFVCAKSNFNLVLLIDVAFYFKCLWKYPTTVLCGPASNETHSRTPRLAIRSVASTQCSPWSAVSEGASTWWARRREQSGFPPRQGPAHLWTWVPGRVFMTPWADQFCTIDTLILTSYLSGCTLCKT